MTCTLLPCNYLQNTSYGYSRFQVREGNTSKPTTQSMTTAITEMPCVFHSLLSRSLTNVANSWLFQHAPPPSYLENMHRFRHSTLSHSCGFLVRFSPTVSRSLPYWCSVSHVASLYSVVTGQTNLCPSNPALSNVSDSFSHKTLPNSHQSN